MARSYRNLWPEVTSWSNLMLAYRRCRRRKRYKPAAVEFEACWESNLLRLQRELLEGCYQPGAYRHFHVFDPKPRKISAAPFRDRIVHHAVVNVLEPLYERRFIPDSYACRRGKGTHLAIRRAQYYLRARRFYLKTDIVKFFPNVDHQVLLELLERTIRDPRLMQLIRTIVESGRGILDDEAAPSYFPGDDLFAISRPRGLPIGNLTSQFFANVLLDPLDHFIKETLRVPGYVRYADDLVLFGDSKSYLWDCHHAVAAELARLRLKLHANKTQLRPCHRRLTFLGFSLSQSGRRLTQDGIRRFNRRLRRQRWLLKHGRLTPRDVGNSLRCWVSHANQANSKGIRRQLWKKVRFSRSQPDRADQHDKT